jgi:hypothetical protein
MARDAETPNLLLVALPAALLLGAGVASAVQTQWFTAPSFRAIFNIAPHCTIKGEVNFITRDRVYHLPGQFYYPRVTVSLPRGERWFCSEAEARSAGWRRSRF